MASIHIAGLLTVAFGVHGIAAAQEIRAPRIWDDTALADWATPIARLNVRPAHYSSAEYYASPIDNLRTYPVYHPEHEPAGYWEWLQRQKPEPLVDAREIRTAADWITAGERAFREIDSPLLRTDDPAVINELRDSERLSGAPILSDGRLAGPQRWVVTPQGLMATVSACTSCHDDPPTTSNGAVQARRPDFTPTTLEGAPGTAWRLRRFYLDEPLPVAFWREFTVPWAPDERIERFKAASVPELQQLSGRNQLGRSFGGGVFARTNGSPFAATKVADLRTLRYSRYLDATGTHRVRGPEDIARYAALVTGADRMDFGPYRILTDEQRRVRFHFADEVLYAIGVYLLSLEPPNNPSPAPPEMLERGERVFERERCARCHAPPAYTTGLLTVATGYTVPRDHPNHDDIRRVSVGTDSAAALQTRKGTGFYKIPSLRGVWYRSRLLHDGSFASLEEMFDPARLEPDYEPLGWSPPGITQRAVLGHEFGLDVTPADKAALLAFLRSL